MDSLEKFCAYLKPPDAHNIACKAATKDILKLLVSHSKFPISSYIVGGGSETGKNTSTCLKADVDVTVFVTWSLNNAKCSIAAALPFQKELILDDWWKIIFDFTEPDSWDDPIRRTSNSLNFSYKGVMIDLLVAFQYFPNQRNQRKYVMQMLRVVHGLWVNYPQRRDKMQKLKKKFQSELTSDGVRWMKRKSTFVSDIARLAKFWSQSVLYIGCGSGKSFLVELIAVKSAIETESSSTSIDRFRTAFESFLEKMINLKSLSIVFEDLYKVSEVPSDILKEIPLVLNPVNQYQNVMEVAEESFVEAMSGAAFVTMWKLQTNVPNFCHLFQPQNEGNILTFKNVIYTISDRDGDFMPELEFPSEWLRPVLNSSCEKVLRDQYRQLRYFIGRSVRLIGASVRCSNFSNESTTDILQRIERLLSNLNCNSSKKLKFEEGLESDMKNCDVIYKVSVSNGTKALIIGFKIIANIIMEM